MLVFNVRGPQPSLWDLGKVIERKPKYIIANSEIVSVYGVDIGCNLITALAELPKKIRMKMEAGSQLYKVITRKM